MEGVCCYVVGCEEDLADSWIWTQKNHLVLSADVVLDIHVVLGSDVVSFGDSVGNICTYLATIKYQYNNPKTHTQIKPQHLNQTQQPNPLQMCVWEVCTIV